MSLVLQGDRDLQDHQVSRVWMGWMGHQECQAARETKVTEVIEGTVAGEASGVRRATQEPQASLGHVVFLASLDHLVCLEGLVERPMEKRFLDHQAHPVHMVQLVPLVNQAP